MLLDIAALLLGIVWVTLRYELVDFLIADQGLTGMDAIRESKRLGAGWPQPPSPPPEGGMVLSMPWVQS